jgi:hypothetical protein
MKLLSEYAGQRIFFEQPSFWKRYHELKVNDEVIATIEQKGYFVKTRWLVTIDGKTWEMYRKSRWRSSMCIRESGFEIPLAETLREGFRGRWLLKLPKGERLKILPHLFKYFCEIKNETGDRLIMIKSKRTYKDKADVLIEKKSDIIDKYPWIVVLAHIVMIQIKRRASHSAA